MIAKIIQKGISNDDLALLERKHLTNLTLLSPSMILTTTAKALLSQESRLLIFYSGMNFSHETSSP